VSAVGQECVPSGCQCACHTPSSMGVAHLVACCDGAPAPIERFGLKLTLADFAELGDALDRVTEAERYPVTRQRADDL
jgi:hypothetical protein